MGFKPTSLFVTVGHLLHRIHVHAHVYDVINDHPSVQAFHYACVLFHVHVHVHVHVYSYIHVHICTCTQVNVLYM